MLTTKDAGYKKKDQILGSGKQLGKIKIILNIIFLMSAVIFNFCTYRWISANNFLAIHYLGYKKLVFAELFLIFLLIVAFVLRREKKRTLLSIVVSIIMIIVLITGSILELVYYEKIVNVFGKADKTLDAIMENSRLSTDEYGVYVLKSDLAQSIADVKDYTFLYSRIYSSEDMTTIKEALKNEVSGDVLLKSSNDPVKMAQYLLESKSCRALILNQTLIEYIEGVHNEKDPDKDDGEYADFLTKVKCIYTISVRNAIQTDTSKKDVTKECFTAYISGIDVAGDIKTKSRSDVNILMTVNPITHQILLVSTPRDYYVPLPMSNGVKDKLTHAGNYGITTSMETLQMLYGIKADYFVRLNFTGFVNIIDALGGVDLHSDYTFYTHGCQFYKGMNKNVPGNKAIWFARERHSFAQGDRQRGKNQMKVIESVIRKCMSITLLKKYDTIMDSVSTSFQTNMGKEDIRKLVTLQMDESPKWKVFHFSVTGTGASRVTYSTPNNAAYVMIPDEASVEQAKSLMNDMQNNQKIYVKSDEN